MIEFGQGDLTNPEMTAAEVKRLKDSLVLMDRHSLEVWAEFMRVAYSKSTPSAQLVDAVVEEFKRQHVAGSLIQMSDRTAPHSDSEDAYGGPTKKYFRDASGKIEKTSDGTPLSYDGFCNDSNGEHYAKVSKMSGREFCEYHLQIGSTIDTSLRMLLVKNGFALVDGKWVFQGKD